jgi:D-3-phosphoglycerate dehydrogenase
MNKFKIVFTDYYYPHNNVEVDVLQKLGNVEIVDCTKLFPGGIKDEDRIIEYTRNADAVIVQFAKMSRKVIDRLEKCKIISRYAIGVDVIDVKAAKEKGIVVANVPDYCIEEVSDTAIAHIFNCVRKISQSNNLVHQEKWEFTNIKPVHRFSALTIGLLAFGNISRRVAEKLHAFGASILAYDPYYKHQEKYPWVTFLPLEEVLSRSDIISIHIPLTEESHHLLNRDRFGLIKKGAIIVNTSRGGLIDEVALAEAIDAGIVAGAGLDVLEYPDEDYSKSILTSYSDKVFITNHFGWYSEEALVELQTKTAMNVYEMLKNGKPLYQV